MLELEQLIETKIPENKKFILLGESFSGPLALRIAAKNPPNLLAVILSATFVKSPKPLWLKILPIKQLCKMPRPFFLLKHILLGDVSDTAIEQTIKKIMNMVTPDVFAKRIIAVLSVDESEALKKINVPILYLRAVNDMVVGKKSLNTIQKLKHDVQSVDIKAPHMLLQTQPQKAWREIIQFTKSLT